MNKVLSVSLGGEEMVATQPVEHIMTALLALEKDPERSRLLVAAHKEWLTLRMNHCAAVCNSGDSTKGRQDLTECYNTFDNQRIEMLNQQRIALLFNTPPIGPLPNQPMNFAYSPESKTRPSEPRSLAVASAAPMAAVTFANDMTEIFDLVSGRLLSRIHTLDADKRRGIYHFFLSPNGRVLIASYHWTKRGLKMWDTISGDLLRDKMVLPDYIRFPMADGRNFIYTDNNRIGIYDIVTDKPIWYSEGKRPASYMALSPDEKWLIVGRDEKMESWELIRSEGNQISYVFRREETVGNYFQQPASIVFSRDNQSFIGALPSGSLMKWQISELKVVQRMRFPKYKDIRIIQVPHADPFLMEARVSSLVSEAFVADLVKEKAQCLTEHRGTNTRMAALADNLVLLATPQELKIVRLPSSSEMLPLGKALGGIAAEALPLYPGVQQANPQSRVDCDSFQTEAIGVYEGKLENGVRRFRERIAGNVVVNVGLTDKPVKLVLSSYEPVVWQLRLSSDARISEILLSGSNESRIEGISQTGVTYIGNAYSYGSTNPRGRSASDLAYSVRQKTGCGMDNFQGSYTGSLFHIGVQSSGSRSEGDGFYKYVDEYGNVSYKDHRD
ncbi:WD40 repeat domain-containing protein [Pelobacter propionicus]|uniref:WD40 repeat domain-containing protein n=1 Tax=Pelobacter propionicus TaxID=29543 RepID=UPI0012EDCE68|nr:WD40 repeat domain-containing protein [Pelobacter propionicus]